MSSSEQPRIVDWIQNVMGGFGFPAFMLFTLGLLQVLMFSILLIPAGDEGLGAFAESFKVWCFGYDPDTGKLETVYVAMLLLDPLLLASIVLLVWGKQLREVVRERPRALATPGLIALTTVVGFGATLWVLEDQPQVQGDLPFPASALRTELIPPQFSLIDHQGQKVALSDLQGRVTLVTAVYATCGYTCPMIMGQAKRAVGSLSPEERANLSVIGITLDPKNDTIEQLAEMTKAQGIGAPLYRLLTGPPVEVERVLDRFGVARERNAETGMIDHANLFILIDTKGRIAYRLTLGDQQERWLGDALRVLLNEARLAG